MDHLLGNANDIGDLAHLCKGGRNGGCQATRKFYDLGWLNVGSLHELDVREQLVRAAALEDAAVGHDYDALIAAFEAAAACKGKPTVLIAKTTKGKGVSFMENNAGWHGKAPNDEQYAQAKAEVEAKLAELEGK